MIQVYCFGTFEIALNIYSKSGGFIIIKNVKTIKPIKSKLKGPLKIKYFKRIRL